MLVEKLSSISLGVRAKNWGSVEEEKPKLSSKLRAEMRRQRWLKVDLDSTRFPSETERLIARGFPRKVRVARKSKRKLLQKDFEDRG
jgi:hypothetical protein